MGCASAFTLRVVGIESSLRTTAIVVSAIDYFAAFWVKIDRQVVRSRRRRAFVLSRRRKRDVAPT